MRVLLVLLISAAVGVPAAYAQVADSAEYTLDGGRLTINMGVDINPFDIHVTRMSISDGVQTVGLDVNLFVDATNRIFEIDIDPQSLEIVRQMENPVVHLGRGAFSVGPVEISPQEIPLLGVVRVGVIAPGGDPHMERLSRLSVDHFNHMLTGQNASWRLDMIYRDDPDALKTILELDKMGIAAAIGNEDAINAKLESQSDMVMIACCQQSMDTTKLYGDLTLFSLVPGSNDHISAVLSMISQQGINRIIPVYPDTPAGHLTYEYVTETAQSAVDIGVRYGQNITPDLIAARISSIAENNMRDNPGARIGVLLAEPSDSSDILAAGALEFDLAALDWFGLGLNNTILHDDGARYLAAAGEYVVPRYGPVRGPLSAVIDASVYDTIPQIRPDAYSAYDAIQILGYGISGTPSPKYPGYPADNTRIVVDRIGLSNTIPAISETYGGVGGYMGMDTGGAPKTPMHDMMGVRGDWWVRTNVHNIPRSHSAGATSLGGTILDANVYEPRPGFVADTVSVGLLVGTPDVSRAHTAAHIGLAEAYHTLAGKDTIPNIVLQHGNDTIDMMQKYYDANIDYIVIHAPESPMQTAAVFARANEMALINPVSASADLAYPADGIVRLAPSDSELAGALAGAILNDGILGLIIMHDSDTAQMAGLVASAFVGESVTIQYDNGSYGAAAISARSNIISLAQTYDSAILVLGEPEPVLRSASIYGTLADTAWYGTSRDGFPDTRNINYTVIGQAVSDTPRSHIISNTISPLHGQATPEDMATIESVRLALLAESSDAGDPPYIEILRAAIDTDRPLLASFDFDLNGDIQNTSYGVWRHYGSSWMPESIYDTESGSVHLEHVGLAVPLTGEHSARGLSQLGAAHLAASAYNHILEQRDATWRVSLYVQDAHKGNAVNAVANIRQQGIPFMVGPPYSASLEAASSYINEHNMVSLSCCSSAPDMAHPDKIYRLHPPHTLQVPALASVMDGDGIDTVMVLYGNNTWDISILNSLIDRAYTISSIRHDTIPYHTLAENMVVEINALSHIHGNVTLGILLAGYETAAPIMEAASIHPELAAVRWYATSRDSGLPEILDNGSVVSFANSVDLTMVSPAGPSASSTGTLSNTIRDVVGFAPDAGAYTTYDAVIILASTLDSLDRTHDPDLLGSLLPAIAGVSSDTLNRYDMDENGDVTHARYNIIGLDWDRWTILDTINQP